MGNVITQPPCNPRGGFFFVDRLSFFRQKMVKRIVSRNARKYTAAEKVGIGEGIKWQSARLNQIKTDGWAFYVTDDR